MALTYFSWANDLDPKGASGARRHIKEVIDPTSSLSLLPAAGTSQDQPLQASVSNDQGTILIKRNQTLCNDLKKSCLHQMK